MIRAGEYKIEFKTPALEQRFMEIIESKPDIRKLRGKYEEYMAKRQFVQALEMKKKMDKLYQNAYLDFLKEAQKEAQQIDIRKSDVPIELQEELRVLYVTAFMACDLIESCVLDMNDAIKKFNKQYSIELFDDLKAMAVKAKEKMAFLQKNSGYLDNMIWGDNCDNMYDMAKNKAKAIIRKNRELDEQTKPNN